MRSCTSLPDGYTEYYSVDLQKDKKLSLLVNGIAILIAVLMVVPMLYVVPIAPLFDMQDGLVPYLIRFGSLVALMVVYMVLHELVHGAAMRLCGTRKIKYGFTGMYAFAGSDDYYGKGAYIFIALSPVVLWGVVLAVINAFVPLAWFWVVYFLQIINVSGAAGDLFVTVRFSRLPRDILIRDYGVGMTVFSAE